ncbi:hypothetical protein H0N95_00890 [Candidatus Micrarchaeota archaeon]|nr:hypothetical protein [Candidatus Micrarchaeota archaeon]
MKNAKVVIQTLIIAALIACMIFPQSHAVASDNSTNITKVDISDIQPVLIKNTEPVLIIKKVIPSLTEPPIKIPTPPRDITPM